MSDVHKHYLGDVAFELREMALEAKRRYQAAKGTENEAYEAGRSFAFYEVMSLLVMQAQSFQMPVEDLRIQGLDPDRDLLGDGSREV